MSYPVYVDNCIVLVTKYYITRTLNDNLKRAAGLCKNRRPWSNLPQQ